MANRKKSVKLETKLKTKVNSTRQIKAPKYKSFKVSKSIKHHRGNLPSGAKIFYRSVNHLIKNKKLFGGLLIIYTVLTVLLVKGFGVTNNLPQLKTSLESLFKGSTANLTTGVTLFGFLLGSGAAPSDVAGAYQTMLLIIISLAVIWALRQTYSKTKISLRDTFYKGIYPLIPFLIVVFVIGLQLIPLLLANTLYSFVFGNGLAVTALEKVLWGLLFFLLAVLSLYMITSSIFAVYIVTLPDLTPMQALRSARELVRFRRWTIMRKLILLPLALLIIGGIIVIPTILLFTSIAEWVYFVLTLMSLLIIHSYIYTLYRELIS